MRKKLIVFLLIFAIASSVLFAGVAKAEVQGGNEALRSIVNKLDISTAALRRADEEPAKASIRSAYSQYRENFSSAVAAVDNALNNRIEYVFFELSQQPITENIFSLRGDVIKAAGVVGVQLSPIYAYAIFVVLAIAIAVSFVVTILTKRMVNWKLIKQNKQVVDAYYKEYREATRTRDLKAMHKIKQRQSEVMKLQNQNMIQTMKPTIIYFVPLILLWTTLTSYFSGWVIAWMPFTRIDLPFFGPLVTFGVGWWYFLTYLGFSQVFRKIIIGD